MDIDNGIYKKLFEIMKDRNYFVITTNIDHQFQKAGFDKARLFYTQEDYGLFQCSEPCHDQTYENKNCGQGYDRVSGKYEDTDNTNSEVSKV